MQHCVVVSRTVRQFFLHSHFDPSLPEVSETAYRQLVRQVVRSNVRQRAPSGKPVTIPGFPDLRSFSAKHEQLLKQECGGAWRSYLQRGNWRMVGFFTRASQRRLAQRLEDSLPAKAPLVLHLVRFPQLTINHAVLVFDARQEEAFIEFRIYDPNLPEQPETLRFDREEGTFYLPENLYFPGGRVDVYQIYHRWCY